MNNRDVMNQIELLLKEVQEVDATQHRLMAELLAEVYVEFNTGKNRAVEQKIFKLIDLEVRKAASSGGALNED